LAQATLHRTDRPRETYKGLTGSTRREGGLVPLLSRLPAGLRNASLVVGGIALGLGVAVGASTLTGNDETAAPAAFGRQALPEGSEPLLDPSRLAEVEGPRTRADSPRQAVEAFLSAEQSGDHKASFGYLADPVRLDYGSPASWAADHPDALPPVTGFDIEGATSGDAPTAAVSTLTRYRSSLDAVSGLVPARAATSWATVREDGGWAVDLAATTQSPILPPDDAAIPAVQAWAEGLQACEVPAEELGELRGRANLARELCQAPGDVRVGTVGPLAQMDAAPLQTNFGADVVVWARTVTLDGPVPLRAVVAPVEDTWTVVGVLDPTGGR
jgi:hypothetical protein